jgi:hypothetical protein
MIDASTMAECANAQGHLAEYLSALFLADDPADYGTIAATDLHLDENRLNECMRRTDAQALVERHVMAGRQLGLRQAPAVLLDGFLISPPLTFRALDSAWSSIVSK